MTPRPDITKRQFRDDLPRREFDEALFRELAATDNRFAQFADLREAFPDASESSLENALDRLASARRIVCGADGSWRVRS